MNNQVSSQAQTLNNSSVIFFKKSRAILWISYISLLLYLSPVLMSLSVRIPNLLAVAVPLVIIFTKNKKIYDIAKIFLILEFIIILAVPLFILGVITTQVK